MLSFPSPTEHPNTSMRKNISEVFASHLGLGI
jgi:hypothetical protein